MKKMNYKPNIRDMLSDYFQSENNDVNEQALFAELAQDSSLREELRLQKHLHNAVASDFDDIYVPAEVTASIFSKLGFYSQKRALPAWGIALLIVAVISIATASYYMLNSDTLTANNNSSVVVADNYMANVDNATIADNPKSEARNNAILATATNADAQNHTNSNGNLKSRNSFVNKSTKNSNKNTKHSALIANNANNGNGRSAKDFSNQGYQENNSANLVAEPDFATYGIEFSGVVLKDDLLSVYGSGSNALYSKNNKMVSREITRFEPRSYSRPFIDDTKWYVAINYLDNSQINVNTNIPAENASYANTSISGAYRFSPSNAVGVEFGFQNFAQSFKINNGGLSYEQSPLLFYYSAYWRYSPDYLVMLDRVYPYMKVLGGGTSSGPIVKGQVGTLLRVYNNLYFNVGAEYGTLFYNVENTLYHPQNIGITLGIQVNY